MDENPDPSGISYNVTTGFAGDLFPPGNTPVTMFARDTFDNVATCQFYVQNSLKSLPVTCPDLDRNVTLDLGETALSFDPNFGADDVIRFLPLYRFHRNVNVEASIDGLPVGSHVTAGRHEVVVVISDDVLSRTCPGFYNIEGVVVNCDVRQLSLEIPSSVLKDGVDPFSLHFLDNSPGDCKSSIDTDGIIHLSTAYDACGTTSESSGDNITFSNAVTDSIGANGPNIHLPVQCVFHKDRVVDGTPFDVTRDSFFSIKGLASFYLTLKRYDSKEFTSVATSEMVPLRQILFFAVSFRHDPSPDLSLFIDTCWATPEPAPNHNGSTRYTFILNGCVVDETVKYPLLGNQQKQGFSIEAFRFLGHSTQVHMHCSVITCMANNQHSRCKQGCLPGDGAKPMHMTVGEEHVSSDGFSVVGPYRISGFTRKATVTPIRRGHAFIKSKTSSYIHH
nr:oncoprotein-induced transcript 3 protein-like [Lytechinus pictus]